jgi:hypothetical protein
LKLDEIAAVLEARKLTPAVQTGTVEVSAGFVSDLLSDVLANAPRGGLLVTVQAHMNVVAVAVHAELVAVFFAAGRLPEEAVIGRAEQENVALFVSELPAFEVVGRLYQAGLRGGS